VRSLVSGGSTDLRQITISYIDAELGREERRGLLRRHFHFECLCPACLEEEADPILAALARTQHSVAAAAQEEVKAADRELLSSLRCPGPCGGRPVSALAAACGRCGTRVEADRLAEYRAVRDAVETVLGGGRVLGGGPRLGAGRAAAPQCMELLTGLLHPCHLTYLRCCQAAVSACLLRRAGLAEAEQWAELLLAGARRLAGGSKVQRRLLFL
jgi:hypothetical protein